MQGAKILCIDDEESVLITIQAVLEEEGHIVSTAQNTEAGLAAIREEVPDLILTDLRIDERDGMEVLKTAKALDTEIIVIMLTGYASLQSAIQALRAGAYDYLIKPCDVEELKMTIARGLRQRSLALALKDRVHELEQANARIAGFAEELQEEVTSATAALAAQMQEIERANVELARLYEIERQQTAHLQELNERKSAFLSMVAHELRTPLTGMRGFTDLLRMRLGPLEARQDRIVTMVTQQVDRLIDLVNELLSLTSIEQQRLTLRRVDDDLVAIVKDLVERYSLVYPQRTIELVCEISSCKGAWDRDRLEQVLSNLLNNALKYSANQPVTVTVAAVTRPELPEPLAAIRVTDRGIGIPVEEQAQLFERFFRASNADAHQSGLGLGLYISHEIVRQHGGWIEVASVPGQGSTFSVVLPMAQSVQTTDGLAVAPAAVEARNEAVPAAEPSDAGYGLPR